MRTIHGVTARLDLPCFDAAEGEPTNRVAQWVKSRLECDCRQDLGKTIQNYGPICGLPGCPAATIQAHGDTKQKFQSEWMQVCTVWNGKITRWRMFSDTAARYGH